MVPVELRLRNFLSYGEEVPPLDFTPFHIACLSGPNGAGKSALLDAITWALWGEARKPRGVTAPEPHLLRLGATEMQVQFIFDLEGDRYLVRRTYTVKQRGRGVRLDLQIYDPQRGTYHTLTEPTLRATQEKLIRILRMDYTTFINSALILQGRPDEFSRQPPSKRKEVLAEILSLSHYERLAERAREKARERRQSVQAQEGLLESLQEQLQQRSALEQELERIEGSLREVKALFREKEEELQRWQKTVQELEAKRHQRENAQETLRRLQQMLTTLRHQTEEARKQWQEACDWVSREEEIRQRHARYEALRRQLQEMERKAEQRRALEEEAMALREAIAREKQRLQSTLEARRERLDEMEAFLRKHASLLQRAEEIRAGAKRWEEVQRELQRQEALRQERDRLEEGARELEQSLARRRAEWEGRKQALQKELEKLRAEANAEPALWARLQETQRRLQHLEDLQQQRQTALEERERLRSRYETLKKEYQRLQQEMGTLQEKLHLLGTASTARCPLCNTPLGPEGFLHVRQEYEQRLQELAQQQEALKEEGRCIQQQLKKRETLLQEWEEALHELPDLQREQASLQQQWEQAKQARQDIPLKEEELARLQRELEEGAYAPEVAHRLAEVRRQQQALGYDPRHHQSLQQEENQLRPFATQLGQLEQVEQQAEQIRSQKPALEQEIAALEEQLRTRRYAEAEQARWEELKRQVEALGYDREAHRRLQEEVEQAQVVKVEMERLEEFRRRLPELEATQQNLERQLQENLAEEERLQTLLAASEEALQRLPEAQSTLESLQKEREDLKRRQEELQTQRARCQGRLQHLDEMEREYRRVLRERDRLRREQYLYEQLTRAFGKDGIQAWLIEQALPEIERIANDYLRRLTQGRAQLSIEPIRDLKTGGLKETLDINISDEAGTRPYEMFSGGEAFRIDFALRIALSHLLAHRAGTRLRTLIIDEGFGTQDRMGLDLMVDAIREVAQDFDKVLVITHLEELKNEFPVRIEVSRSPERGSWFEVVM